MTVEQIALAVSMAGNIVAGVFLLRASADIERLRRVLRLTIDQPPAAGTRLPISDRRVLAKMGELAACVTSAQIAAWAAGGFAAATGAAVAERLQRHGFVRPCTAHTSGEAWQLTDAGRRALIQAKSDGA